MSSAKGKYTGKVVLVTGASKGIGAEIARAFGREGALVVVNYASSRSGADKVVADIQAGGSKAVALQGDFSKPDDITRVFNEAHKAFGRLDVLVNNAGIYDFAPLEAITSEHFHKTFDLNVLGLLLATKEAVARFGESGGSVVNISSVVSKTAFPNTSVYSATKAAVDSITRVLAAELGPKRIRVNSVNPGMVETEGTTSSGITSAESQMKAAVIAQTPLGRIGAVDDIAPVVLYLASDDAKWITGETIYVSGGQR
ncbi:MAG: glucose 1-dehydrogenase [Tepidisphaeraceae bacterium]